MGGARQGGKKAKQNRVFTVMVVPHARGNIRSFRISLTLIRAFVALILLGTVVLASFAYSYHNLLGNMEELQTLRSTSRQQKEEIEQLKQQTSTIQQKLLILDQLDAQIRAKLNLPKPTPPREPQSGQTPGNAPPVGAAKAITIAGGPPPVTTSGPIGGAEISPRETVGPSQDLQSVDQLGKNREEQNQRRFSLVSRSGGRPVRGNQELTALAATLAAISSEVAEKEQTLQQLNQAVDQKVARDAATPLGWPCQGEITSTFGYRRAPFGWGWDFHPAIDIAAPWGTPVAATANGVVRFVGWKGGLGRTVILDHGFGFSTLYGHLTRTLVKEGQKVTRGETIGLLGSTGLSTGPHVHYEVWVEGKQVDPWPYMQKRLP